MNAAARSSVRSGWERCVEPGGAWAGLGGTGGLGREPACPEHWPLFSPPSYEFMRRSLIFYRNEIQKMTGKVGAGRGAWGGGLLGWGSHCRPPCPPQDPLEQFGISEEARFQLSGLKA